jgi:hypothetical protein
VNNGRLVWGGPAVPKGSVTPCWVEMEVSWLCWLCLVRL